MLNAASQSLPVLMLAGLFGPTAAGFYSLGKMALGAPTQLLGQSVATVFYPHFNETILNGRSGTTLLLKSTVTLGAVGLLPFASVMILGPWMFGLVFGEEWRPAGEFAQWMAAWLFVDFINRPSVSAIAVLKLQGLYLVYEIMGTLFRAAALYFGYVSFGTALSAIICFSLVSVCLNIVLVVVTFVAARRSDAVNHE